MAKIKIEPAKGKLGILLPGLGAVSTTFIAGVMLARKGLSKPIGSLTQMQTIRLGKRDQEKAPLIRDFVPLASLSDLEFASWDIFPDNAYESAMKAGVLSKEHLDLVKDELEKIKPIAAVFDGNFVRNIRGPNIKKAESKLDACKPGQGGHQEIQEREEPLKDGYGLVRKHRKLHRSPAGPPVDQNRSKRALRESDPAISPSMVYAYAAMMEGVPYANGAPAPHARHTRTDRACEKKGAADSRQGLQDRADTRERPRSRPC